MNPRALPHFRVTSVLPGGLALAWLVALIAPASAQEERPAVIIVRVVADARVEVDGAPTTQTGTVRRFQTPALAVGKKYSYTVTATWNADGVKRTVSRTVSFSGGQEIAVDFRPPSLGWAPWGPGIQTGNSVLTVENGTSTDALVRLVRLGAREQLVRNFYIPAGRSFTASNVPPGDYVLRVAYGTDWDIGAGKFTSDRSFSQTEQFDVTEERTSTGIRYSRIRITLHKVVGGNFSSTPSSEEDFERLRD
jgi:uncharacterized protein (TIGR03000 family)